MSRYDIKIKRVYSAAEDSDGYRVLVDRLWPRGIKKSALKISEWAREISPSNDIRKAFAHRPEAYPDFKRSYTEELDASKNAADFCGSCLQKLHDENVTLLYSAKDEAHNNAVVLKEWIGQIKKMKEVNKNGQ